MTVLLLPARICPVAPPKAQAMVDQLSGNVLWGVAATFAVAILIAIGAIAAGRLLSLPHASKGGVISLVVIFGAGILLLVVPGVLSAMMGSWCIG